MRMMTRTIVGLIAAACLPGCSEADGTAQAPVATMMNIDILGVEADRGLYVARRDAGDVRIPFALDLTRVAPERFQDGEQVMESADGVVVMLDAYASRAPVGDRRCADGRETYVRAFSLAERREVFSRLAASCLSRIDAAEPIAVSTAADAFRIEGRAPRDYRIDGAKISPVN